MLFRSAGPGTIAEALAMNLPIIITSWRPGQEEGNVSFVIKSKVGFVARDPKKVVEIIIRLQYTPEFNALKENIKKVRKPHAALDIANCILKYL